jgi:hypothetical protein
MADQYRQINGPHGPINFPASMSDDEVTQAMRKLYPPQQDVGSVSAYHPSAWEQFKSAVPAVGHVADIVSGKKPWQAPMPLENAGQLVYPERMFSPSEQEAHPVRTGFDEFMGSLTSPDNLVLMKGLGALGMAPGAIGKWLPRIASGVFGAQMGKGSLDTLKQAHQLWAQYKATGDESYKNEAMRLGTHGLLDGAMAGLSALHATKGTREAIAPKRVAPPPPVDTPIAASGKMESEAKVETTPPVNSSPKTGSSVNTPAPTPVSATPVEAIKPETPLAGARASLTSPPESGIMVPEGEGKPVFTPRDLQQVLPNKPVPKLGTLPKPEVKPNTPETADPTRMITDRMMQLRRQGLSDPEQVFQLTREFPKQAEDIIRGYKAKQLPKETPSTTEAVQPKESVPTASTPEKAGESVSPTPRPEVARTEPRSAARIQGLPDLDVFNKRVAEMLKKTPGMAEGTAKRRVAEQIRNEAGAVRFGGDEDIPQRRERKINSWIEGLRDPSIPQEQALRYIKNLRAYGLDHDEIVRRMSGAKDFAKGNENPDVTLSEKYQRRAFKGKLLREVIDPDKGLDANFKTISDYGWRGRDNGEGLPNGSVIHKFENANGDYLHVHVDRYDRIIGSRFEAANQDADESLEERIGDPKQFLSPDDMDDLAYEKRAGIKRAHDAVDRVMGKYVEGTDARLQYQAGLEGKLTGEAKIEGVKDPGLEELDKIYALKDPRAMYPKVKPFLNDIVNGREGERGSLSFRRLPKEKREEYHPLARLADVLDKVADFFEGNRGLEPEAIADKKLAKNIIREAGSGLHLSHLQVEAKLDDAIKRHDSPLNERENFISFMDAGEGKPGAQFLHPEDQALSNELHSMFEERWDRVKAVKGLESDGIDNYLAHIWEKPGKAGQVLAGILQGKRPLEGSARFLKNRFYQFASTGIDHGLTPVSWNPIRLQLQALFDTDRFLMAHEIKDRFKDAGLVQWVSLSNYKNVPPGWARLNDKIFQPKVAGEGALKEYGTYYAPPEVAKVFNNYLSPGLGKSPLYRNVRGYQNRLNMINLGISAYHGTMIGLVASTSDLALGLQKVANNKDVGGLKDIFRGTIGTFILRSAAQDYKLGRDIQNEAISPTGKPQLHTYVDLLQQGGARFKQDTFYTQGMSDRKGFLNSLKLVRKMFVADSPQEAGVRGVTKNATELLDRTVRGLAAPIMDKYVPRIKLGAAARMMEAKLHHMIIEQGITDQGAIADEMGKIWNSIDNRAGQMVYDNLFWNKTTKDLAFLGVRAVGWDLGSVREYGGAVAADLPRQLAKGLRGERPELTSRMAFTLATPITIGIFGAALHYMMTGKAPQKSEDYFFPGPDGNKISFPSYMKDFYSFKSQPFKTAVNKLHPSVSQMYQMYENADFYGTEIYHPGDDKFKQGMDVLKWYGSTFLPLTYSGIQRRIDRGEAISSSASSLFGFMPAPASIGQTKAENLAFELAERGWQMGPRTRGDAERHALVQKLQRSVASGQDITAEMQKAWLDKRIQDTDIGKIYGNFGQSKLVQNFKELKLPDALAVMREASPEEQVQLKPLLLKKYGEVYRYPADVGQQLDRQIQTYFR